MWIVVKISKSYCFLVVKTITYLNASIVNLLEKLVDSADLTNGLKILTSLQVSKINDQ